jgi:hypothetical protein
MPTEAVVWEDCYLGTYGSGIIAALSADRTVFSKTAVSASWNCGGLGSKRLVGDGYVETVVSTPFARHGIAVMADPGVRTGSPGWSYSGAPYALVISTGPTLYVYESNVIKLSTSVVSGDAVRIVITGTTVTYTKNGATIYTSTVPVSGELVPMVCAFDVGSYSAVVSGEELQLAGWAAIPAPEYVQWWHDVGMSVDNGAHTIQKTAVNSWSNAYAAGTRAIHHGAMGYVELVLGNLGSDNHILGLSNRWPHTLPSGSTPAFGQSDVNVYNYGGYCRGYNNSTPAAYLQNPRVNGSKARVCLRNGVYQWYCDYGWKGNGTALAPTMPVYPVWTPYNQGAAWNGMLIAGSILTSAAPRVSPLY